MTDVLADLAHLTIILAGIVLVAARWRWIKSETVDTWDERANMRHRAKVRRKREQAAAARPTLPGEPVPEPEPEPGPPPLPEPEVFVIYKMADGTLIDDFQWVTGLEWFDDRDSEIRLIKRTYALIAEEEVVLPDPYQTEEEDEEPE